MKSRKKLFALPVIYFFHTFLQLNSKKKDNEK